MANLKSNILAAIALVTMTSPARADLSVRQSNDEVSRFVEFTSDSAPTTGTDVGPIEERLLAADPAAARVTAGDVALVRIAEGAPGRTSSGSALTVHRCDQAGFDVAAFGQWRPEICPILARYPVAAGAYAIVTMKPVNFENHGGIFYKSGNNWVELAFAQSFKAPWGATMTLVRDDSVYASQDVDGSYAMHTPFIADLINSDNDGRATPVSYGAVASYRDGYRTILPPGLSIVTKDGLCTRIKPFMEPLEVILLSAKGTPPPTQEKIAASFKDFGCPQKDKSVPWAGLAILFGIPLAIIGAVVFLIRRFRGRRRGALPSSPSMAIPPAEIPMGMSYADAVRAKGAPFENATSEQGPNDLRSSGKAVDRLRAWRALDPKLRRNVLVGAGVLLAAALFLIFRPSSDPTAVLRKLEAGTKSGAAPIEQGTLLVEETLTADILTDGKLVSPAAGHTARFAWYRPDDIKILFDTFSSASDAEAAMKNIRAHGPAEVLLLPASARGAATPYSDTSPVPFRPEMTEECRNTAAYLYCMVAPDNARLLVTVRLPADPVVPIPGVANANSRAKDALRGAIDRLREAGIGT